MRVVQINAVYGIMSTGRTALQESDFLWSNGHECTTFYGECPGNYDHAVYMGNTVSHKIHAVISRIAGDAGIGSWQATKHLLSFLKDYRPDIVHIRNLHGNFVHVPMLLKYLADNDIPTVVSLHDCWFFTGGCTHYTANSCDNWLDSCDNCQHLRRGSDFIFNNKSAQNLARKTRLFNSIPRLAVCGVSKWTENEARASSVFRNAKIITHIYNWVNLDSFKPESIDCNLQIRNRIGVGSSPMVIGIASGWSEKKGLSDFKKLATLLPDVKFVLVGKMPENIDLPNNIIPAGLINEISQLAKLYSAADVFVHLSLEETFGKVTAEALACGTPAVVYDSTASPELVDRHTGRVATPGDIQSVADYVIEILGMPSMTEACRARAEKLFDMNTNLKLQVEVYNELISY